MATGRSTESSYLTTWSAIVSFGIMALGFPWHCLAQDADSITFYEDYNDALREAKKTRKPIFLEFRCAP